MNPARIEFDQAKAAEMSKLYSEHRGFTYRAIDHKIEQAYRQIARGKKIIMAFESIRQAGLGPDRRPKLAIIRADAEWCWFRVEWRERVQFSMDQWPRGRSGSRKIEMPWPNLGVDEAKPGKARVPFVPPQHRPKAKLDNYYILWEADWVTVPVDPMLLRHMGGDLWLVLAAWDLTPVERAVLA